MAGSAGAPDSSFPGPHRFPFRFVDRVATDRDDRPLVEITGGAVYPGWGRAGRGSGRVEPYPLSLLVEIMAQGALAALAEPGEEGGSGPVHLAGIDGAEVRSEVLPGDHLRVDTRVERAYGRLTKVQCSLDRDGEEIAVAGLLLSLG